MNLFYNFFLILFVMAPFLSERWLNDNTAGLGQSIFIIPFIVISMVNYKADKNRKLYILLTSYMFVVLLYFLFSGLNGVQLLITMIGCTMISLLFTNTRINNEKVSKVIHATLFIYFAIQIISFYFGFFWGIRNEYTQGNFRFTYMNNNENLTSQQLCFGLSFFLYNLLSKSKKKITKITSLLLVIFSLNPILATVSRTGIFLGLITLILFYIVFLLNTKKKVFGIVIGLFALIAFSGGLLLNQSGIDNLNLRLEDTDEDIRFELWDLGMKLVKENFITGVGFENFLSMTGRDTQSSIHYVGVDSFGSIHNSFLELLLVTGIPGLIIYTFLIYYFVRTSVVKRKFNFWTAHSLTLIIGIILFSITGQSAFEKLTWFIFGYIHLNNKLYNIT